MIQLVMDRVQHNMSMGVDQSRKYIFILSIDRFIISLVN